MKLPLKLLGILAVLIMVMMVAVPAGADTGKPSVTVSDVKVTPGALMSGDTGTITITITNPSASLSGSSTTQTDSYTAASGTSEGMVTPSHQWSTSTTNSNAPDGAVMLKEVTLLADSPIHVISKYQYLDVGRLGMGNSAKFTFTIKVDDNVANALYPLTLKIRTDDSGVYLNYPLTVQVDNSELNVILNDAPQSFSTSKKSVVIDIVNPRPNQVDGVSVIPSGNDFVFKPIQEYSVGSIGAGELYTVQFDVTAKNTSYSGNPSFKVTFMNGQNQHQADPLTVYTDHSTAAASGASSSGDTMLIVGAIVLVILVVIGGIFVFMRSKR